MNKQRLKIQFLLTIAIAFMLFRFTLNVARAEEMIVTAATEQLRTDWVEIIGVEQFNPELGTLTQIDVSVGGTLSGDAQYENLDADDATITLGLISDIELSDSTARFIAKASPSAFVSEEATRFDDFLDFVGPSGSTFIGLVGTDVSDFVTFTEPEEFAPYIGNGTIDLVLTGIGRSSADGPGNLAFIFALLTEAEISIKYTYSLPSIDIEKWTNGPNQEPQDADEPTGPEIFVGNPVEWTYLVTNTGLKPLTEITVTDDQGVAVSCPASELEPAASMTCTGSSIAEEGQYVNIGTVAGQPVDESGNPEGALVTDSDPSHYIGVQPPSIDIEKLTNGPGQDPEDADEPTGPEIRVGDRVEWTYQVTNSGGYRLTDIHVADDQGVDVSCPQDALSPGESMTCTGSGAAEEGQYANLGTVTGQPVTEDDTPIGDPATDEDPSHYNGMQPPSIDIEKLTGGPGQDPEDADEPMGPEILIGDPVEWIYEVTNTGGYRLTNIAVTDDRGVEVSCPQDELSPGDSMVCTGGGIAEEGQYANLGTVSGQPVDNEGNPDGNPVTDEDPSHYIGLQPPAIVIEKFTNGPGQDLQDADELTGPEILMGEPVTWTYIVTNTGDLRLIDIAVSDDQGVDVSCPETILESGESMTCIGTGTAAEGQYRNVGSATGQPVDGEDNPTGDLITDDDPSHYIGLQPPKIVLEKFTNGSSQVPQDADEPTGPQIEVGEPITWTYIVTNTGDLRLINVTVTDDQGVDVTCPFSELEPGASMTCLGTGIAEEGQYTNLGTVTGQPVNGDGAPAGDLVTDQDPSHYISSSSQICIGQLPDVTYLGSVEVEGDPQATFVLPDGYEFFVIKRTRPRPSHYVTVEGTVNSQGERIYTTTQNRRERVWACAGDCDVDATLKNQAVELGQYGPGTTFYMVMLDLNDDDRDAWWAADDPDNQTDIIPSSPITTYLEFDVPFDANWYFSTEDSVGLLDTCIDDGAQGLNAQNLSTGILTVQNYRIVSLMREIYLPLVSR